MNFVKTTDFDTAEKLSKSLKLINKSGNCWTFLNDRQMHFSDEDKKKITYSNKLEMA